MPRPSARSTLEEIAQAEDSNDDDYDDRSPRPMRGKRTARSSGNGSSGRARKKQRRGERYRGSDLSDDEDLDESEEEAWTAESAEEEVMTNEKGRPIRRGATKTQTYEESDVDDMDELKTSSSDDEIKMATPKRKPKKIVRLKVNSPLLANIASTRSRGPRTSSSVTKPITSSALAGTRRSRRLSHDPDDDDEPVMELSSSGKHAQPTAGSRAGSREPISVRPTRGSKGIKYPSKSTIDEDEEPQSSAQQEEFNGLEIKATQQTEIVASQDEPEAADIPQLLSDLAEVAAEDSKTVATIDPEAPEIEVLTEDDGAAKKAAGQDQDEDDEDEDAPVRRTQRDLRKRKADSPPVGEPSAGRRKLRSRGSGERLKRKDRESSDFDPDGAEEEEEAAMSGDESDDESPVKTRSRRGASQKDDSDSAAGRRSTRLREKGRSRQASQDAEDEEEELAEELAELKKDKKERGRQSRREHEDLVFETRGRRGGSRKNYDLLKSLPNIEEDDEAPAASPSRPAGARGRATAGWQRSLFSTYGPFGGAGGRPPVFGGPAGRQGGLDDSDSSDDEIMKRPPQVGGMTGMTPTTATPFNPFALQSLNADAAQTPAGVPANLGKIKDKQALADADPLGVDQNVDFDSVGGLQGHIDQLKEMVALPLLYPEIFMRFKITPPRGVLFHGPPGTGKTLLARALATSVSTTGRKVTFYMRKGADALSKWVGEAERQLRMLFDEARKTQPSIIFFDEIDGLAPVRSSKQEQIHASIVSTLLALMDGMDGRGQVIVIGATNRPDSVDPALRRPGRFDREFYFPLPDVDARRSIINIHTRGWDPPLDENVKTELAEMTKGYGGADLRALCTEAALNAVQRRYPQIYKSKDKLLIDPKTITVTPKDFMISIKKMTPSSERSAASGASPLPASVAPLLSSTLIKIQAIVAEMIPQKKKTTALEEAQYEDVADGKGFRQERMQQAFESSRVFRPRLLIQGRTGMGQQYISGALLNHFQGMHVQSFDLSTILGDVSSTAEATIIRLFAEVKMHKPSVIYIPNLQEWYGTVGKSALSTFMGLLRSIKSTDPILVLGILESEVEDEDEHIRQQLFGFSKRNQYILREPTSVEREEFFKPLADYITTKPDDFPDPTNRKRRNLEILPPAPPEKVADKTKSREELKAEKKRDRHTLNVMKTRLQPIMDQIRTKYKKFRTGVIEEHLIRYLFDEADSNVLTTDLALLPVSERPIRPFEVGADAHGVTGLVDQTNGKFYYNIETVTIEKRLSNGFYKRPKDFLADIKRLAKDAKTIGDEDRQLKANELLANVEVDINGIEIGEPALWTECEKAYQRELQREKDAREKGKEPDPFAGMPPPKQITDGSHPSTSTNTTDGPIKLGERFVNDKDKLARLQPITPSRPPSGSSALTNGFHRGPHTIAHTGMSGSNHTGNDADVEGGMDTTGETPMHDSNSASQNPSHEKSQKTGTSSSYSTGAHNSAQPRPFHSLTAPSQQLRREAGLQPQLSQEAFVTPMQAGSQAADYYNEASTTQTTSGQKNTNSGPSGSDPHNTQESGPNLFMYDERRSAGGTDIPDTQESRSESSQPSRYITASAHQVSHDGPIPAQQQFHQAPAVSGFTLHRQPLSMQPPQASPQRSPVHPPQPMSAPVFPRPGNSIGNSVGQAVSRTTTAAITDILNPTPSTSTDQSPQAHPTTLSGQNRSKSRALSPLKSATSAQVPESNLALPPLAQLQNFIKDITDKTSGLSVEQLEQVNSSLMDTIWKTRGEWNRKIVLAKLGGVFNETLSDMREVGQDWGPLSWERSGRSNGERRLEGV